MHTVLEILVVQTMGAFLNPQEPFRLLWLHAFQVRDGVSNAKVVTLTRSFGGGGWEEHVHSVSWERVGEILELLSEIGIPGRELQVKGTPDTSDTWTKLILRIDLDERVYTLNLDMLASGYEGEDAEALGRLLRKVEGLIEVDTTGKNA